MKVSTTSLSASPVAAVSLDKRVRTAKGKKDTDNQINISLCAAGNALGSYTTSDLGARTTCAEAMTAALKGAISAGLTVEMLKAGLPAYVALVDAIQSVRLSNKVAPLADATRDNYVSRIRSFVKDTTKPLDIFGNLRAAAMALTSSKSATPKAKKQGAIDIVKTVEIKGVAPLGKFLAAWIELNDGSQALLQIRKMAQDLLSQVNVAVGVKK